MAKDIAYSCIHERAGKQLLPQNLTRLGASLSIQAEERTNHQHDNVWESEWRSRRGKTVAGYSVQRNMRENAPTTYRAGRVGTIIHASMLEAASHTPITLYFQVPVVIPRTSKSPVKRCSFRRLPQTAVHSRSLSNTVIAVTVLALLYRLHSHILEAVRESLVTYNNIRFLSLSSAHAGGSSTIPVYIPAHLTDYSRSV